MTRKMAPSIKYHDAINGISEILICGDTVKIWERKITKHPHSHTQGPLLKDIIEIGLAEESKCLVITSDMVTTEPDDKPSDKLVVLIMAAYKAWCAYRGRTPKEI